MEAEKESWKIYQVEWRDTSDTLTDLAGSAAMYDSLDKYTQILYVAVSHRRLSFHTDTKARRPGLI